MNHEELENLIWAHIDGELNAADQQRLDSALADSPEARECFTAAQSMSNAIQRSLQTQTPDLARARLLAALAAEKSPTAAPTPIWAKKWPAAVAAAVLLLAWMYGLFDRPGTESVEPAEGHASAQHSRPAASHAGHSGLLQLVAGVSRDFHKSIDASIDRPHLNRERLKEVLAQQHDDKSHQIWSQKNGCGCRMRLKQCSKRVESRLGRPYNLPDLSKGLQLEAFRIANVDGVETPHLIMTRGETEVSVYIFTKEHVKELFGCLCRSTESTVGEKLIRGCPDCRVVVRCFDDQVLVFISRMKYTELKNLVLDV